jgi:hypothetical protein
MLQSRHPVLGLLDGWNIGFENCRFMRRHAVPPEFQVAL